MRHGIPHSRRRSLAEVDAEKKEKKFEYSKKKQKKLYHIQYQTQQKNRYEYYLRTNIKLN